MRSQLAGGAARLSRRRLIDNARVRVRRITTESSSSIPNEPEGIVKAKYSKSFQKRTILSGIQPTGVPHLGNYLGALRRWKDLQAEKLASKHPRSHQLFFSIVDLHALTGKSDRLQLSQQIRQTYASLLAIGLDPKECIIFVQSQVLYHPYLMWILSTVASTGYLSRMTQWKSKLGLSDDTSLGNDSATEKLKLGLFSYPVLQAADILLYKPTHVPVGEDQAQHIELARSLAKSFNAHYGSLEKGKPYFHLPRLMLSPAKRVMSLKDPQSKMSKSDPNPASRILITDSPSEIQTKLRGALTDSIEGISYDPETRPGVSNLVEILKHVSGSESTCAEIATDNANLSMRAFKEHVANNIIKEFEGIRDRFDTIMSSSNSNLDDSMDLGNAKARSRAGHTMHEVEQIVGLKPPRPNSGKRYLETTPDSNKEKIQREQKAEEEAAVEEPDVLPQAYEGVDRPIAS